MPICPFSHNYWTDELVTGMQRRVTVVLCVSLSVCYHSSDNIVCSYAQINGGLLDFNSWILENNLASPQKFVLTCWWYTMSTTHHKYKKFANNKKPQKIIFHYTLAYISSSNNEGCYTHATHYQQHSFNITRNKNTYPQAIYTYNWPILAMKSDMYMYITQFWQHNITSL